MKQDDRHATRREQMTKRTDTELREIAAMECVVPLDRELALLARREMDCRRLNEAQWQQAEAEYHGG